MPDKSFFAIGRPKFPSARLARGIGVCAAGLAAAALTGCTELTRVPGGAASLDALIPREETWVEPDSGGPYQGRFFRVEGDSLLLLVRGNAHVGTPLGRIRSVRVRRFSLKRTAKPLIILGAVAGAIGILVVLGIVSFDSVNEEPAPPDTVKR